jgi:hypothetical protein
VIFSSVIFLPVDQGLSEDQLRSYVAYKAKNYNAGVTGSHEEETREEGSVGSSSQGPSTGEEGTDDANRLLPRSSVPFSFLRGTTFPLMASL